APLGGNDAAAEACTPFLLPPSVNVDSTQWANRFPGAPTWTCDTAGTTTIDSGAGTASSTSCALAMVDLTNGVTQTAPLGPPVMVVRLRGLSLSNGHVLRIVGDKPVVFLVAGPVTVDSGATIDASAVGTKPGPGGEAPGASSPWCQGSSGTPGIFTTAAQGSAAGGGGGLGTAGGQGGGGVFSPSGGSGGAPSAGTNLQPLRGGCSGGGGGSAPAGAAGASGGAGGGAFEISASGGITIGTGSNAATLAAAGGGSPAPDKTGGMNVNGYFVNASGGGGSGGGILLVGPTTSRPSFGSAGIARVHGGGAAGSYVSMTSSDPPATAGADGHLADDAKAAGGHGSGSGIGGPYYENGAAGGLYSARSTTGVVVGGSAGAGNYGSTGGGGGGGRVVVTTANAVSACE
ncbi:MAG: hypothetical protein ACRENE_24095, partial [Polyangiaceae bacterium]